LRRRALTLIVLTLALSAALFFLFGLQPMIERIAESRFIGAANKVEARLDQIFEPTAQLLTMARQSFIATPPVNGNADSFNRIFRPILATHPLATSAVAGNSDGVGWMLLHRNDGSWLSRSTDLSNNGIRHQVVEEFPDGHRASYSKYFDYDPRQRAWFQAAMEDREHVQWTAPYYLFTTGDPGISASLNVALPAGGDLVIGLDLMLRDLSSTTANASIGEHGQALVLTADRRVLALPAAPAGTDAEAWLQKILSPASDLGLPAVSDALAAWKGQNEVVVFHSGHERWLTQFPNIHSASSSCGS